MSFPRYPKYKASGVEWLGDVPEHWDVFPLRRCLLEHRQCYYSTDSYTDTGVKLLRITDLQAFGRVEFADCPRVEDRDDLKPFLLQVSDFVFARTGGAGTFGLIEAMAERAAYASYLIRFRFSERAQPRFLKNYFLSTSFQNAVKQNIHGGVNQNIHAEDIKNQHVAIPPTSEQTAIAAFLDRETGKIDSLVAEQRRLIELLKEKRQAVISHAVTKGLNPQAPTKPSGIEWLGDVPEHWDTPPVYLRYAAVLGKMLNASRFTGEHPIPYLRNADVQWDEVNTVDLPVFDIEPDEFDRFTLRSGDILICEGGAGVGQTAIWRGELDRCAFQKALHRLRPWSSNESPRFFCYCMRFAVDTGIVLAGGTATIPHLTGEKLRSYRFPRPTFEEQCEIVAFLDAESAKLDTLTAEAQRGIELLQERRTALISAAVTGKIDVRNLAPLEVA